jgi:GNAT superfamily N-acetyltransferase
MLRIYSQKELESKGISLEQVTQRLMEIDVENNLFEKFEDRSGMYDRIYNLYKSTPELWRVLMSGDTIIGYFSFVSLGRDLLESLEAGTLLDSSVKAENFKQDLWDDEPSDLMLDTICLGKQWQKKYISGFLIKSMHEVLLGLMNQGVKFRTVWGSVWSDAGMRLFKKLGAKFHTKNEYSGDIYKVSFGVFIKQLKATVATLILTELHTLTVHDLDVELINLLLDIDSVVYDEDLQGNFEDIYGRFKANRDMFVLLYNKELLIGYMCFFPITDELYERIKEEDRLFDTDINGTQILDYKPNNSYKLYVLSAAIRPEYQGKGYFRLLSDGFNQFITEKREKNITFISALTTSVSEAGYAIVKKLGFEEYKTLSCGYIVHELEFLSNT